MRKTVFRLAGVAVLAAAGFWLYQTWRIPADQVLVASFEDDGEEGYDGPWERDSLETAKIIDPSLGYVPYQRLAAALDYTEQQQMLMASSRVVPEIEWEERGPIRDIVGPSNGNLRGTTRANLYYTSGRIRAVLIDRLNDPSGNTVFAAGVAGGLWKCTNFLSTDPPNWQVVNDYFSSMAINSICQDPTNPQVMYFSTGEPTGNADAVNGNGIYKSTDGGASWQRLPSAAMFSRTFKLMCDGEGNVYAALRVTTVPTDQPFGLVRSKDGGATWQNITPNNLTSTNLTCTDIEISSTGRMHAAFGYLGNVVNHAFTDDPANVTRSGWTRSSGIQVITSNIVRRMELATQGNVVYAITVASSNNVDSCYRSLDGGVTWERRNPAGYANASFRGQGWYNLTLAINPNNPDDIVWGAVDSYRSLNGGQTVARFTAWVSVEPYVHADHHFIEWWNQDGENRILMGGDGGLFYSNNSGGNWRNRNENLAIKQFYAAAIHPGAGSPYLIAGSQDNGSHQISTPGLSGSVEVTGGDGAYVHINQQNPDIQFTSYVYAQYRRSVNGGATWTNANFSSANGLFINPFDVDDATTTMYAAWTANNIFRWPNANTSASANLIATPQLNGGIASAFKVSPHTANRLYVGSNGGRLLRIENAHTVTGATLAANLTDLTGPGFRGFLNCINTGSSDNYLVAVFTNYGVNNVWYSRDGGQNWDAVDGDLPDMPVRWAMFHPQFDNRLIIATEAGIYTTDAVNGTQTRWKVSPGFPTVRTNMIKYRPSDHMIVAATHGRGLFTGKLSVSDEVEINFVTNATPVNEGPGMGETEGPCRAYRDYTVELGILNTPASDVTVRISASGTAARPQDYAFTTNGNFANPSQELVFPAGSTDNRSFTVRIYDDAEVESTENISISFEVLNGADAQVGVVDTHEFIITDNDRLPQAEPTTEPVAVGQFNSQLSGASPFAANRVKHRMQTLYTAAELAGAGMKPNVSLHSLRFEVLEKYSTQPYRGMTVSVAATPATNLAAGFLPAATPFTTVYSGDYSTQEGWNTMPFSTPIVWDGVSNLVFQFCFDNSSGSAPADFPDLVAGNLYPLFAGVRSTTFSSFSGQALAGCELPAAFVSDGRMNATFGVDFGVNPIAVALNTSRTEFLLPGNNLHYFSNAGEIMLRIRNNSQTAYGCLTATLDRAGSSAVAFWNANPRDRLTSKTWRLSGSPAAQGPVEITFYFTEEEKQGWEAATGNNWSQIQLVRTSGAIKDVTPSNAKPNNNGTVLEVVNPVHGRYGSGYTLTATFESAHGGFAAGMPGRQFNVTVVKVAKAVGDEAQTLTVLTNPFRSEIRLRFAQPTAGATNAVLADMNGRVLQRTPIAAGSTLVTIPVGPQAANSRGVHILQVSGSRDKTQTVKLLRE